MADGKIAFYSDALSITGIERNILSLAEWLRELGREVFIMCAAESGFSPEAKKRTLPVVPILTGGSWFSIKYLYRLARLIKEQDVRLLVVFRLKEILIVSLAKSLFYKKLILVYFQQSALSLRPIPALYKLPFSLLDAWIVPSENTQRKNREILRYFPARTQVIAPCIDVQNFARDTLTKDTSRALLNLPGSLLLLGCFCKFNSTQKPDFLIRVVQFLHRNHYDIGLLIMGQPEDKEEKAYYDFLQELAHECGMEQKVYFRPFTQKLITFYRSIDIFIVNAPSGAYDLAIAKAMASGVPVMAVRTDHHADILGNGNYGLLYSSDKMEDISSKIIHLITQPKLVEYLRKEACRHVQIMHDKQQACSKLEKLFNKLLEK
jgi:glycosyltransferase involved in cell wall biosynthesis